MSFFEKKMREGTTANNNIKLIDQKKILCRKNYSHKTNLKINIYNYKESFMQIRN